MSITGDCHVHAWRFDGRSFRCSRCGEYRWTITGQVAIDLGGSSREADQ